MKPVIIALIMLGFPGIAYSTQVSGDVWGVWDSTMNPIEVVGELRVRPDSSLIIGPGCYIEFQGHYALTLDTSAAFIRAIGTEEDSIFFTPAPGRVWNGIDIFFADTTCEFSYCVLEKAHAPIEDHMSPGGAIHCWQTNLDIKSCRITSNRAESGRGGGIYLENGDISISNSIVSGNLCAFGGSGLYAWHGNASITGSVFERDTTWYPLGGEDSGPVECNQCSTLIFSNNIIRNNLSYRVGAIKLEASIASVTNNIVNQNLGWIGRSGFWIDIEDSATIAYNEITHNGYLNSGGFEGSGLYLEGSNVILNNNLIAFNEVWNPGGGVYIRGTDILLVNNIIAYNRSSHTGGIYIDNTSMQSPIILKNNIIWGNVADVHPQIFNEGNRPLEISYCDVEGGWQGVGNIDIDPLFRDTANGDFRLMSTFCGDPYDSPCIDAGDPTIQDYLLDCDWGLGSQLSDIGAYGGGDSTMQVIEEYIPPTPGKMILLQNYPNPFNAQTTISYVLPVQSDISISIFNILGQEVEVLYMGIRQPGAHTVNWNASDYPSGVYFARLKADDNSKNIKMLLLK